VSGRSRQAKTDPDPDQDKQSAKPLQSIDTHRGLAQNRKMKSVRDVFARVTETLGESHLPCLLIGGFAVNYYGYTRNTLDVDFMIAAEQLDAVRSALVKAGFINVTIEENVAFFNAPECPFRVDFLRVDAATLARLLDHAQWVDVQGCRVQIPALLDLLAMKIFALAQNTARRSGKDLADIAFLSAIHRLDEDRDIKPLCDRFGSAAVFDLIRREIEAMTAP